MSARAKPDKKKAKAPKRIPDMKIHPAAEFFPMLEGEDLKPLLENMKTMGQQQPGVVWKETGELLDGRNRVLVCKMLGIEPLLEERSFRNQREAIDFIVSCNLARRHLNIGARTMIASQLAALRSGQSRSRKRTDKKSTDISSPRSAELGKENDHILTQDEAAKKMRVSSSSVKRAKSVQKKGSEKLQQAVKEGKVTISAAVELTKLPKKEQDGILSRGNVEEKVKELRTKKLQAESRPPADTLKIQYRSSTELGDKLVRALVKLSNEIGDLGTPLERLRQAGVDVDPLTSDPTHPPGSPDGDGHEDGDLKGGASSGDDQDSSSSNTAAAEAVHDSDPTGKLEFDSFPPDPPLKLVRLALAGSGWVDEGILAKTTVDADCLRDLAATYPRQLLRVVDTTGVVRYRWAGGDEDAGVDQPEEADLDDNYFPGEPDTAEEDWSDAEHDRQVEDDRDNGDDVWLNRMILAIGTDESKNLGSLARDLELHDPSFSAAKIITRAQRENPDLFKHGNEPLSIALTEKGLACRAKILKVGSLSRQPKVDDVAGGHDDTPEAVHDSDPTADDNDELETIPDAPTDPALHRIQQALCEGRWVEQLDLADRTELTVDTLREVWQTYRDDIDRTVSNGRTYYRLAERNSGGTGGLQHGVGHRLNVPGPSRPASQPQ